MALNLFESVLHLTQGQMIVSYVIAESMVWKSVTLLVGLHPKKDRSRDLKDAVIPIMRMTRLSVPLPPNGKFLARRPCRPGSPYVCTYLQPVATLLVQRPSPPTSQIPSHWLWVLVGTGE